MKSSLIAFFVALAVTGGLSQDVTTIITHGFTRAGKPVWVEEMAKAIIERWGSGIIYRYRPSDGFWEHVPTPQFPPDESNIVLIFNWEAEDDFGTGVGANWRYVYGAADALYASLRDAHYLELQGPSDLVSGRVIHFIGHSRGASVNSEAVLRLGLGGIDVEQMTALDSHPVNGEMGDDFFCDSLNWGDPTPWKWMNVGFADSWWREDNCILDPFDFDGLPLFERGFYHFPLIEGRLVGFGYEGAVREHADVHLWYHGTIDLTGDVDDGDAVLLEADRPHWYEEMGYINHESGYFYSWLGGGVNFRPGQGDGRDLEQRPILLHGGFTSEGSYSGWSFHGGGWEGPPLENGPVDNDNGEWVAALGDRFPLGDTPSITHNHFFLPGGIDELVFRWKPVVIDTGDRDDVLRIYATMIGEQDSIAIEQIPLFDIGNPGEWRTHPVALPDSSAMPRDRAYTLTFLHLDGGRAQSKVHIDDVTLISDSAYDVPNRFPTIQAAIDGSNDGDVVTVGPGLWAGPINFNGKNLHLLAPAGANLTTIDAQGAGSVVTFQSGEGPGAVLDGFTVINGVGGGGGGIRCAHGTSPTIRNCVIRDNSAAVGGGVYIEGSAPQISNCDIISNISANDGGGLYVWYSTPTIVGCRFFDNQAGHYGGAAVLISVDTDATFIDCVFTENLGIGGGIAFYNAAATIDGCSFSENNLTAITEQPGEVQPDCRIANSFFCGNVPVHIDCPWTDLGGNTFESDCQPGSAALLDVSIITGVILDGSLNELGSSDNDYLHTRSGFGSTFIDLHHMEMQISAVTSVDSPASLDLTIETRIDEPAGTAQVRLFNHNTQQYVVVGSHPLGATDSIRTFEDIDSGDYINPNTGEIELRIKHIVFVPFLAYTFESWIDWVEIQVR